MRKLLLGSVAAAAAATLIFALPQAGAGKPRTRECGIPARTPLWIDFGHGTVPFWKMFARPGMVVATANFLYPPQIRARGAATVYLDLGFHGDMGTLAEPTDPEEIPDLANGLYDYAAASLQCRRPWLALNELWGAGLPTPWPHVIAQYRANVLRFVRILAARGAHPLLFVNSPPYTAGEAGTWWREVAKVAEIIREVYFQAPRLWKQGPYAGSRAIRKAFRRGITDFTSIGIPPSKLGVVLGFHKRARHGLGARRWFETVKWQALAARQVARELKFSTIWSWGWGRSDGQKVDREKREAACVYLWVRERRLCDGPKGAGPGFDASLTEGQIRLPAGVRCTVGRRILRSRDAKQLARVLGDRQAGLAAAFERLVIRRHSRPVTLEEVLRVERAIVAAHFGSVDAYRGALRRAGVSIDVAREVIRDLLVRSRVERRLRVLPPTRNQAAAYYENNGDVTARLVRSKPSAAWLGGKYGVSLATLAPERVFTIPARRWTTVRTPLARYRVRAEGAAAPLAAFPFTRARAGIEAVLRAAARENAFKRWSLKYQRIALKRTACRHDELPEVDSFDPTEALPFLALDR